MDIMCKLERRVWKVPLSTIVVFDILHVRRARDVVNVLHSTIIPVVRKSTNSRHSVYIRLNSAQPHSASQRKQTLRPGLPCWVWAMQTRQAFVSGCGGGVATLPQQFGGNPAEHCPNRSAVTCISKLMSLSNLQETLTRHHNVNQSLSPGLLSSNVRPLDINQDQVDQI